MLKRKSLLLGVYLMLTVLNPQAAHAEGLASSFGKIELIKDVTMSPNGHYLASVFTVDGKPVVMTSPFGSKELTSVVSLKFASDRIDDIQWANDERMLITASSSEYIKGQFFRVYRTYAVNADGSDLIVLEDKSVNRQKTDWETKFTSMRLVNRLAKDPAHVLISSYDARDPGYAVFKVNIYDSKFAKVESAANNRGNFVTDLDGNVMFSTTIDEITETKLSVDVKQHGQWKTIKTLDITKDMDFTPIALASDGKSLLVNTDYQSDFNYIARFDLASNSIAEPLFQVEGHDVSSLRVNGDVVGYTLDQDFPTRVYLDEQIKAYQQQVDALLKGRQNYIQAFDLDRTRVVVYSVTDNKPGRYYTIDFKTKKADLYFSQYPQLEKVAMQPVEKLRLKARDGLAMDAYLTVPENAAKAPLIVFPHGGPTARDYMAFDPWLQFFVKQGYAVLQVNFRGSEGYGNDFEIAGYKQWGKAMQDDLIDAMASVSKDARVDTGRSCMVGASYGGYAALTASFRDADKFQCFVSISGISDLAGMLQLDGRYNKGLKAVQQVMIGDYDTQRPELDKVSAFFNQAAIKKPLLLIHGVKDTRVSYKQSEKLYEELKEKGAPVEYLELKDGTHFFDEESDRIQAFEAMEVFLSKHLPTTL